MTRIVPGVRYTGKVSSFSFGQVPERVLRSLIESGRISGILLEYELAAAFGLEHGGQGAGADLLDDGKRIQVKSFRKEDPSAVYLSGARKGALRCDSASIWTTKSGFWDRRNRLSEEQLVEAEEYLDRYDFFLYLDISRMAELEYEFVMLPASVVKERKDGFCIAQSKVYEGVTETRQVPAPC